MLYLSIQNRARGRTSKVSEAAGARCDFVIGLCSDYVRAVVESSFYWRKQLNLQISWQAQYLVRLEADCACPAHCK